jgi:hypothetical protein
LAQEGAGRGDTDRWPPEIPELMGRDFEFVPNLYMNEFSVVKATMSWSLLLSEARKTRNQALLFNLGTRAG